MRCTIIFSADNPDTGDGYCSWCHEELRYTPAELSHRRAEGLASPVVDRRNWKRDYQRAHPPAVQLAGGD